MRMDIHVYMDICVWICPYISIQIHHWETKPLIRGMGTCFRECNPLVVSSLPLLSLFNYTSREKKKVLF